jgi:UDP-N-acetylmuramate dehydrogenase
VDPKRRSELLTRIPCPAREQVLLAPLTTFRIGGPAQILAEPRSEDELHELLRFIKAEQVSFFFLGHGSNLLISDNGFDGIVLRVRDDLCIIKMQDNVVCAEPGARLLDLTAFAAAHELTGMEPLSGIPGSVGGGLYMNAGAYGAEICDTLVEVDVLTPDLQKMTLCRDEIGFHYRSTPALQDKIILQSRYLLRLGDHQNIYREMRRVWKLRRAKQPLDLPSAGSVFKRPPGDFAGRLIEEVSGKGTRIGGAIVSPKHAGFIVNVGTATAADVTALVREIRSRVYERFHIILELEIKPVGFAGDPFAITL